MKRRFHLHLPGLLFVALTLFVGFAAANRPNNLVVLAFGALLAFILVSGVISGSMMVRLRLVRLETRRAVVGEPFEIRYNLTNASRLRSAFAIRIDEVTPTDGIERGSGPRQPAPGWSIRIGPGETQVCDSVLWPRRRGVLRLDRVRMKSFFPFGLVGRSLELSLPESVLVHPRVHPVRPSLIRSAARGEFGGIRMSRQPGTGEDFYSVREFRPGDSVRHIAWKRRGISDELLVVQRSSSAPPRLMVRLDLSVEPDRLRFDPGLGLTAAELEERAITMAASVIDEAERLGHEYALIVSGLPVRPVPMRRGHWHRERLMSTLAGIDLSAPRTSDPEARDPDERDHAVLVIHPGRIDTVGAPERAWHWTATRIEDLLDLEAAGDESAPADAPAHAPSAAGALA